MKKILITGGAGFIGTYVTSIAQHSGHEVSILDNLSPQIHGQNAQYTPPCGVNFYRGDITNRGDIENCLCDIDTIVHLAAETGTGQSMYEIERYYNVNVQGTALLFDILANQKHRVSKVILASSRSVYGEGAYICTNCTAGANRCFPQPRSPDQLAAHAWDPICPTCSGPISATATREDDALAPASIYASTKLAQEELVRVACSAIGIPHAILRFQNVFGEGQSLNNPYTGILSIFSTRIRLGLALPIFEDGLESRDFIHAEDVARAIVKCIERDDIDKELINVGFGEAYSIMHVAQLLCEIMNSEVVPHITAQYRIGDIRHNFADITKMTNLMGLKPEISLEKGLERFCDWVSTQPIPKDFLDKANAELRARNMLG